MTSENKSVSAILVVAVCALSLAANADTFWKGQGADSDFYNRDNWQNWWNGNYVFGGGQLGILPQDGSYVTFTNVAAIAQGLWIENAGKGGVEWSLAETAEEGSGLTITNSLTIGTGRAGQLTIKSGDYLVRSDLNVAAGLGTTDGGSGTSTLTLTNCTLTANKVFVGTSGANGANGEIVVNAGAVLNSLATSGDVFAICQGKSGHTGTTGSLTINGGIVNVASDLYTCQDSGTGIITINSGELNVEKSSIISRGYSTASASTVNISGGKYWTGIAFELAAAANRTASEGTINMTGGELAVGGIMYLGGGGGGAAKATVHISDGDMSVTNNIQLANGNGSTGTFTMDDGNLYCERQFWLGNGTGSVGTFTQNGGTTVIKNYTCVGYGSGSGKLIMNGGTYTQNSDKFIVGQGNANDPDSYGEVVVNGGTVTVPTLWMPENAKPGTLKMNGGEFISTGETQLSRNSEAGKGTLELNGGVFTLNYLSSSSGTGGEIIFNGGTLAARASRENFIPDIANLKLTIAAGGAVIDTDGHNVTIADTFENADGLVGNGMIWKKGLGTLTISSNLDLERTFKFTIHDGIGPIALTGSNTFGGGKKISVMIDPVSATTNVAYAVLTGLGELTMDDIEITGDDFYTYTGAVADGTLTVTLAYGPTAPVTARYVNGKWGFYNAEGNFIQDGKAADLTSYIFTGAEPTGELATLAANHNVILESGTFEIDSAVAARHVFVPDGETVTIRGSGSASFAVDAIVSDGTLVFDGIVTLSGAVDYPFSIAADARVTLVTPQTIGGEISGTGTLALTSGTFSYKEHNTNYSVLDHFAGTIVLCEGATLNAIFDNRLGMNILLGSAKVRMEGARINGPADNNSRFNNEIELAGSTVNHIYGYGANLVFRGGISGDGDLLAEVNNRTIRMEGDNSGYAGSAVLDGPYFIFNGGSSASSNAVYTLNFNRANVAEGETEINGNNQTLRFGALRQLQAGPTFKVMSTGTTIEIGAKDGTESTIEGQFTNNPLTLKKVGADSWLTLGTNFDMVAGSAVNIAEGGLGFNLPDGETVTALTNATVSIDSSVTARVSMSAAQYEALDPAHTYTLAKLGSSPGVSKLETILSVDGEVPQDRNAGKWRVRFVFVGATAQEDAHYEAVLAYSACGFIIIIQ